MWNRPAVVPADWRNCFLEARRWRDHRQTDVHKNTPRKGAKPLVNVYLKAIAPSGSNLTNKVSTSAKTQDFNQTNNSASATVHVK